MSTELTTRNGTTHSLATNSLAEVKQMAELFISSGLFADTKNVAQGAVKILAGKELGLGPFESMRDISIIQGKTTMAGAQIAARIKKTGTYDYEIVQFDDQAAVLRFTKNGKALKPDISFSIGDAKKLGLAGKDNYNKQARTMLFWRAVTMGARMHCPEVFGGAIYTPDELRGGATQAEEPIDAEFTQIVEPVVTVAATGQPAEVKPAPQPETKRRAGRALPNPWLHKLEGVIKPDGNNTLKDENRTHIVTVYGRDKTLIQAMAQPAHEKRLSPDDLANIRAALASVTNGNADMMIEEACITLADDIPNFDQAAQTEGE